MAGAPDVSVVVATRNRATRLRAMLASLRAQTLPAERFEVIVVNDGSSDGTAAALAAERPVAGISLRVVHRTRAGGPAAARNAGLREARGTLVAFIDDDCVAEPEWLAAGLAAWAGDPQVFVQGATGPLVHELPIRPFDYSVEIARLSPEFEACNMFYPRALLERLGGFDAQAFPGPGEDVDLGWRAQAAGARPRFAPAARVHHAVTSLGPTGKLRRAWNWTPAMLSFARHSELRRVRLIHGVFWNWPHYLLVRALIAVPLARRRWAWPLAWWLACRLLLYEIEKGRRDGSRVLAAYWLLHDVVETAAVVRGAVRYRTLVI